MSSSLPIIGKLSLPGCRGHRVELAWNRDHLVTIRSVGKCPCSLKAVEAQMLLGGKESGCHKTVAAILSHRVGRAIPKRLRDQMPDSLLGVLAVAEVVRAERDRARAERYSQQLIELLSLRDRFKDRTLATVSDAIDGCSYRRSQSRVGGDHSIRVNLGGVGCSGGSENVWQWPKWHYPGTNSIWRITVPMRWLVSVWRVGITVVDGFFVLDAVPSGPVTWKVKYVKQGRGFALVMAEGVVTRDGSGCHLRKGKRV